MKANVKTVVSVVFAAVSVVAFSSFAAVAPTSVQWDWSASPGGGLSAESALDYFTGANWRGDNPAQGGSQKGDFSVDMSGVRYVKIAQPLTVADLASSVSGTFSTNASPRLVLIGDSPISLKKDADISTPAPKGIVFYSDVSWYNTIYPGSVIFCGDVAKGDGANKSLALAYGTPVEIRYDLYANSADPVRVQPSGFTSATLNAGDLSLVAPHGSDGVTGFWSQKADSPFIERTGAAHVLCAGAMVTGEGIPAGTFVKRIFSDSSIELSANAEKPIVGNELQFSAFQPKVSQSFSVTVSQVGGTRNLNLMKWREEDEFCVTLTGMSISDSGSTIVFGTKDGALPATTVIQSGVSMKGIADFRDCRIQFGIAGVGGDYGFPNAAGTKATSDSATSYLGVTNGLHAQIAKFTKLAGTVVKTGEGSLDVELTGGAADYTGAFVVQEGDLSLTHGDDESLYVNTLAISNGATLHVPEGGLRCGKLHVEQGASVSGPGAITVETFSADLLGVKCLNGARILYTDTTRKGEIILEQPATNVPGNPAVWFDASNLSSLTYENEDGVNRISQWNDVRGSSVMSSTPACDTKKPELHIASSGCHNFVHFQQDATTGSIKSSYELTWNRKVTDIVSVFKVVICTEGGGQFLGASSLWRAAEHKAYSNPVFYYSLTNSVVPLATTRFYVNGDRRDFLTGYAYGGAHNNFGPDARVPQVAELHLDATTAYAQGFSAQENTALGRNGRQDLCELIVYTNRLTETERLAVTGYLMRKWLNASVDFETVGDVERIPSLNGGSTVGIADGTQMAVDTLGGEGVVRKVGDGHLYIADCHSDSAVLNVEEGVVSVRSVPNTADALPAGTVLHLDATAEDTYIGKHVNDGVTYLTEWGYVQKTGSVKVKTSGTQSTNHPKVVPNVQNGLPMIDFGSFGYSKANDVDMTCSPIGVRTFFAVQNSENGGGYLFGDDANNCYEMAADGAHGLIRNPVGTLAYPIIYSRYTATLSDSGPGATRTSLNGTEVDGLKSYYSGGNDLLTIQSCEKLIGNSISCGICNGANYGGGKMIGEQIYYETCLSDEETKRVEAYLQKKWFGVEKPLYRPALLAGLSIGEGATLSLVGGAPLFVGSCSGVGTVKGSISFSENSVWRVTANSAGISSGVKVTGSVDLSGLKKIVLSPGLGKAPKVGSYSLISAGSLIGDLGSVTLDVGSMGTRRHYRVRQTENEVVLDVLPKGLLITVR